MHNIEIELDKSTWPITSTVPNELSALGNSLNFNILDLLLHVADSTKNPNDQGMGINNYWAFLRYVNCFENHGDLKLLKSFQDMDPHQKTILSDDIGMGCASLAMSRSFGVKTITDTGFFVKHLKSIQIKKSNKRGPNKSPDFIILDNNNELHIIECKGTQNNLDTRDFQLSSGVNQKRNVLDPNGLIKERLVIGTFIAKHNSTDSSSIKIIDPEFNYDFSLIKKEDLISLSLYYQFQKELSYILPTRLTNFFENLSLDDQDGFKIFSEKITSHLQNDSMQISERTYLFDDVVLRQYFTFETINYHLHSSQSMREFLNNFSKREKTITEQRLTGMFGLQLTLEVLR